MSAGRIETLRRVLRDPFYRHEVRRNWSWRRYVGMAFAASLSWIVGTIVLGMSVGVSFAVLGRLASTMQRAAAVGGVRPEVPILSVHLYLDAGFGYLECFRYLITWMLVAVPLRLFLAYAVTGRCAAASRQDRLFDRTEQFAVTTLSAKRYCLSRLAGQLRGSYVIGGAISASMALVVLTSGALRGNLSEWHVLAGLVFLPVDGALVLAVAGSIGIRFGTSSASTPAALLKTYLAAFLLVPASLLSATLSVVLALHAAVILLFPGVESSTLAALCLASGLTAKLALGALWVALALRDARRACEGVGFSPAQA